MRVGWFGGSEPMTDGRLRLSVITGPLHHKLARATSLRDGARPLMSSASMQRVRALFLLLITGGFDFGAADLYTDIVALPGDLWGKVQKQGHVPFERWHPLLFNSSGFLSWVARNTPPSKVLEREGLASVPRDEPAPLSFRCVADQRHMALSDTTTTAAAVSMLVCVQCINNTAAPKSSPRTSCSFHPSTHLPAHPPCTSFECMLRYALAQSPTDPYTLLPSTHSPTHNPTH